MIDLKTSDMVRIGSGEFGTVYRIGNRVVKVFPPDMKYRSDINREFEVLKRLKDVPSVLRIYDNKVITVDGKKAKALFMEYIPGYTLKKYITCSLSTGWTIPESTALEFARALFSIVSNVHEHDVVHHDIKPANIIFTDTDLTLIDFGMACLVSGPPKLRCSATVKGTLNFMSPEMLKNLLIRDRSAYKSTDVWACGITIYQLVNLYLPYEGKDRKETIENILQNRKRPSRYPGEKVNRLIDRILVPDHRLRPTADEVCDYIGEIISKEIIFMKR